MNLYKQFETPAYSEAPEWLVTALQMGYSEPEEGGQTEEADESLPFGFV